MFSAPGGFFGVQIITVNPLIHKPHTLTLSPSLCSIYAHCWFSANLTASDQSDQQVMVIYPEYPGKLKGARFDFTI